MKNNESEAIILPPDEYVVMIDMINDYELLTLALARLNRYDQAIPVPEDKVWENLGISDEDLETVGEAEFE
ncbi:MAG: hypothetical protein K5637_08045 [Lachnospiraceae bacterium]|nr:hypothetical protein [Lachnospiraceae bacterium]